MVHPDNFIQRNMASLKNNTHSILYVDGEETNLKLFKRGFRRSFDVHTAISGDKAIEILRTNNVKLIITNTKASDMGSSELLSKTHQEFPEVINIILTGNTNTEHVMEEIGDIPVYKCVLKPYEKNDLERTINEALGQVA